MNEARTTKEAHILFVTGVRQGLAEKICAALYINAPLKDLEYEWFLISLAVIEAICRGARRVAFLGM
jgi:hypothetical protein